MMSEYENPTITFYPHESEFDVTPEEQKPALSTNECQARCVVTEEAFSGNAR